MKTSKGLTVQLARRFGGLQSFGAGEQDLQFMALHFLGT